MCDLQMRIDQLRLHLSMLSTKASIPQIPKGLGGHGSPCRLRTRFFLPAYVCVRRTKAKENATCSRETHGGMNLRLPLIKCPQF